MSEPVAPTAENLAPLIVGENVSAHYVDVTFRCPVTGDEWTGTAKVDRDGDGADKSFFGSLRRSIGGLARSMFGGTKEVAGAVTRTALAPTQAVDMTVTAAHLGPARIEAFKSVQRWFAWDAHSGRWVSAKMMRDLQPELVQHLQQIRVTEAWDRGVLARMLAEIAGADGALSDSERDLFFTVQGEGLNGKGPTIEALIDRAPLSDADLGETSRDVRFELWLLATAMAVSDRDIAAREATLLERWGKALGIPPKDQQRGLDMARDWVVDQALEEAYADGRLTRAEHTEVLAVAQALGVPRERVDQLDTRCRKRRGMV